MKLFHLTAAHWHHFGAICDTVSSLAFPFSDPISISQPWHWPQLLQACKWWCVSNQSAALLHFPPPSFDLGVFMLLSTVGYNMLTLDIFTSRSMSRAHQLSCDQRTWLSVSSNDAGRARWSMAIRRGSSLWRCTASFNMWAKPGQQHHTGALKTRKYLLFWCQRQTNRLNHRKHTTLVKTVYCYFSAPAFLKMSKNSQQKGTK